MTLDVRCSWTSVAESSPRRDESRPSLPPFCLAKQRSDPVVSPVLRTNAKIIILILESCGLFSTCVLSSSGNRSSSLIFTTGGARGCPAGHPRGAQEAFSLRPSAGTAWHAHIPAPNPPYTLKRGNRAALYRLESLQSGGTRTPPSPSRPAVTRPPVEDTQGAVMHWWGRSGRRQRPLHAPSRPGCSAGLVWCPRIRRPSPPSRIGRG